MSTASTNMFAVCVREQCENPNQVGNSLETVVALFIFLIQYGKVLKKRFGHLQTHFQFQARDW